MGSNLGWLIFRTQFIEFEAELKYQFSSVKCHLKKSSQHIRSLFQRTSSEIFFVKKGGDGGKSPIRAFGFVGSSFTFASVLNPEFNTR